MIIGTQLASESFCNVDLPSTYLEESWLQENQLDGGKAELHPVLALDSVAALGYTRKAQKKKKYSLIALSISTTCN